MRRGEDRHLEEGSHTAIFTAKIKHVRLTWSPFTSEQMLTIGQVMVDKISDRISQAIDITDSPAKALSKQYERRKLLRNRAPVRDWNWRGLTMRSLKAKSASEDRVTIGFITQQANSIVTVQNRIARMWGVSEEDTKALQSVVRATLLQSRSVRITKEKVA